MDPVLYSFHAPHHGLDVVARYVLRDRLADHLLLWRLRERAQSRAVKSGAHTAEDRLATLLKRGRTLSFRALGQAQRQGRP